MTPAQKLGQDFSNILLARRSDDLTTAEIFSAVMGTLMIFLGSICDQESRSHYVSTVEENLRRMVEEENAIITQQGINR